MNFIMEQRSSSEELRVFKNLSFIKLRHEVDSFFNSPSNFKYVIRGTGEDFV
jgi:hypothetical protein